MKLINCRVFVFCFGTCKLANMHNNNKRDDDKDRISQEGKKKSEKSFDLFADSAEKEKVTQMLQRKLRGNLEINLSRAFLLVVIIPTMFWIKSANGQKEDKDANTTLIDSTTATSKGSFTLCD